MGNHHFLSTLQQGVDLSYESTTITRGLLLTWQATKFPSPLNEMHFSAQGFLGGGGVQIGSNETSWSKILALRTYKQTLQTSYNSRFLHGSYAYMISHIWNQLPSAVKNAPNASSFRRLLTKLNLSAVNAAIAFDPIYFYR